MIDLVQCSFESRVLGNTRTVWVQRGDAPAAGVCVFLDGEHYLAHLRAADIVRPLQGARTVAYVSCIDFDVRWPESFCNPGFATFLADELTPWLTKTFSAPGENVLAGLSLTGLAAAHAALRHPDVFPRVLCQSGSFWWKDGWLTSNLPDSDELAFRITVGNQETKENVDHGKGLIQVESQAASNRRMRDALVAAGHRVSYEEFAGAHDIPSWRNDLPGSLSTLFEM